MGIGDQTALAQHFQVAAHSRGRQTQVAREIPRRPRTLPQTLNHGAPMRIGERCQSAIEPARNLRQSLARTERPPAAAISSCDIVLRLWLNDQTCPSGSTAI